MVKLVPLYRVLNSLKRFGVNKVRFVEIVLAYYGVAHVIAGVMLSVGLAQRPNVRNTWLNKLPVPQPSPVSSLDGVDNRTLYIHALYFTVNTISHVAIGDLTPVSESERMLSSFIILWITILYAFLFANIGSLFKDGNNFLSFH